MTKIYNVSQIYFKQGSITGVAKTFDETSISDTIVPTTAAVQSLINDITNTNEYVITDAPNDYHFHPVPGKNGIFYKVVPPSSQYQTAYTYLEPDINSYNERYMETKKEKMHHMY